MEWILRLQQKKWGGRDFSLPPLRLGKPVRFFEREGYNLGTFKLFLKQLQQTFRIHCLTSHLSIATLKSDAIQALSVTSCGIATTNLHALTAVNDSLITP